MPISINQISPGTCLLLEGNVYTVLQHQHVKPGKGGAFAKVKIKNLKSGQILEKTLKSSDKFDEVILEEFKLQNLYTSGDNIHFMNLETFEEVQLSKDLLGDQFKFLQENLEVNALAYKGEILNIELPNFIIAEIIETDPGLKGDSSRAGTKPAVIDAGATVQVPLFIQIGEKVKIDTRTGAYVERVK